MPISQIISAVLLAALSSAPFQGTAAEISESQSFLARDGTRHTLTELRGHPAVINFWATWCGPCRAEMPRLQRLADSYTAREVQFIAISLDGPETSIRIDDAVRKRGLRVPVWTGADARTLASLQLGALVPATLILDENGVAIGRIEGEARAKDIESRLDWLLSGRHGPQPKPVQKNDW